LDSPRFREVATMPEQLNRYHNAKIIDHLASNYVIGTLSTKVRARLEKIALENNLIEARIHFWQQELAHLDNNTAELPASEISWQKISAAIDEDSPQVQHSSERFYNKYTDYVVASFGRFTHGLFNGFPRGLTNSFSVAVLALAIVLLFNPMSKTPTVEPLNYVAVLTDDNAQAHLVASTYGESKRLVMNLINQPKITDDEDLEVWVVSKTDKQARSLGILPRNMSLVEQQLTEAQWRLIKDSDSLIVTIEEQGGSPIGEPSDIIVSRGLCVRLQEWQDNA